MCAHIWLEERVNKSTNAISCGGGKKKSRQVYSSVFFLKRGACFLPSEFSVEMGFHPKLQWRLCPASGLCNTQLSCISLQFLRASSDDNKIFNNVTILASLHSQRIWIYNISCTGATQVKQLTLRTIPYLAKLQLTCAWTDDVVPPVEGRTLELLLSTFFCCKAELYLEAALRYSLSWKMASAW